VVVVSVGQLQAHKIFDVGVAAVDGQLVVVAVAALLEDRLPAADNVAVENPVQHNKQF
jgi:hypothetical protein